MLKCTECGTENSVTANQCPKCGSTSQFRGYKFTREEVKEHGFLKTADIYNFQKRGGKIKTRFFHKLAFFSFWIFVIALAVKVAS